MNRISRSKKRILGLFVPIALVLIVNHKGIKDCALADHACNSISMSMFTTSSSAQLACSQNQKETVSWFDWIGGKSASYQFHFLDLLELLYDDDALADNAP